MLRPRRSCAEHNVARGTARGVRRRPTQRGAAARRATSCAHAANYCFVPFKQCVGGSPLYAANGSRTLRARFVRVPASVSFVRACSSRCSLAHLQLCAAPMDACKPISHIGRNTMAAHKRAACNHGRRTDPEWPWGRASNPSGLSGPGVRFALAGGNQTARRLFANRNSACCDTLTTASTGPRRRGRR